MGGWEAQGPWGRRGLLKLLDLKWICQAESNLGTYCSETEADSCALSSRLGRKQCFLQPEAVGGRDPALIESSSASFVPEESLYDYDCRAAEREGMWKRRDPELGCSSGFESAAAFVFPALPFL